MSRIAATATAGLATISGRLGRAGILALAGLALLFVAGFAQPDLVHNAAHDARHAFAFPCH
jgi:cobalt transporter subunit CbtB